MNCQTEPFCSFCGEEMPQGSRTLGQIFCNLLCQLKADPIEPVTHEERKGRPPFPLQQGEDRSN
jgi:hypothetical protein